MLGLKSLALGSRNDTPILPRPRRIPSMIFCRSTSIVMAWRTLLSLKNGRSLFHMMAASVGMEYFTFANCCSNRSEEHTSELQSQSNLVCRLLLEKKKAYAHIS